MAEVKMTKKNYFELIKEIVSTSEYDEREDILAFVDAQIAQIDSKAEKAKQRAAEKKVEGDELREIVKTVLNAEYQTREEVYATVAEVVETTITKVGARLTQLVASGEAVKEPTKTSDGRKVMSYALAPKNEVEA